MVLVLSGIFRRISFPNHSRLLLSLQPSCCDLHHRRHKSIGAGVLSTKFENTKSRINLLKGSRSGRSGFRSLSTNQPFPSPYQNRDERPKSTPSKLTAWILKSPTRKSAFLRIANLLGYGSPKQVAARRARIIYAQCSEVASGLESTFWHDGLALPPTFQSWFTVTNLHVWMATVRLRALPPSHGRASVQALIDYFFFDAEDRLRAILGKKAPERLVTRQMKILREQWNGLNISCDIAFIAGDKEMASTMWRNLLGARGARGISYEEPSSPSENRNSGDVNILDPSTGGVVEFEGSSIDKYVLYPQLMLLLTSYIRREIAHLEAISDHVILGGDGWGLHEVFEEVEEGGQKILLNEAFIFGSVGAAAEAVGMKMEDLPFQTRR